MSVSGEVGVVNQIEFQGRSFAGASVSNYGVVETGDVVYTKSPLRANPYGIIKANKGKSGIVSTLYAVYKTIQGTANADFIECYFDLDDRLNTETSRPPTRSHPQASRSSMPHRPSQRTRCTMTAATI